MPYHDRRASAVISAILEFSEVGRRALGLYTTPRRDRDFEYNHLSSLPYRQQYGKPSSSLTSAQQEAVPTKLDYFRVPTSALRWQKCPPDRIYARIKHNCSDFSRLLLVKVDIIDANWIHTRYCRLYFSVHVN